MAEAIDHAYGYIKKTSVTVYLDEGLLSKVQTEFIIEVSDEIIGGKLDEEFPPYGWQTGSGTQTNKNINEVIFNPAIQLAGDVMGSRNPIHSNDHVNLPQSSNDMFPAAMHIATVMDFENHLISSVESLIRPIKDKAIEWARNKDRPYSSTRRSAPYLKASMVGLCDTDNGCS
jgi:fumarate hydratase class II